MDEGVPVEGSVDGGAELAALRRRAYAADADIEHDPVALARLAELEDLARLARDPGREPAARSESTGRAARNDPNSPVEASDAAARATTPVPATTPAHAASTTAARARSVPGEGPRRRPRWHAGLVAGTAVLAVALAGAASVGGSPAEEIPDARLAAALAVPVVEDRAWASSQEGYLEFLDSLRDDVLEGAGADLVASRIIRDRLRPYGGMNGRSVWAGPTIDGTLCLVVSDVDAPAIACALPETVKTRGISIVLPAGYADSDAESVFPPGQPIRYTLGPDLSVTTQPATE